jgi:hypothetical protein
VVAFEHTTSQARLAEGSADGIGKFVGVQDGAATGRPADEVPAARFKAGMVDIGGGLRIAKGKARR